MDGTGKPPYRADILIKDDRISAIGNFPSKTAELVIDGLGLTLSPGIIDGNTDSDHFLTLFTNPEQQDFLLQGITTIIGGQCGSSLAPILYGSLKSIRKWGNMDQINVNWHSVGELKQIFRKNGLGVNFATLIGHSTIRRDLLGDEVRDLTDSEMDIFENSIQQGMRDGALGLSTGLGYIHARHVSYSEIKKLLSIVAKNNGIYATHLRDERGEIVASVEEAVALASASEIPAIVSHFRPISGFEDQFQEALKIISGDSRANNVYFDANPFDFSIFPLYSLLPGWAQHKSLENMLDLLRNENSKKDILNEMKKAGYGYSSIIIAEAKENPAIIGKTLLEFSESRGLAPEDGLLALMEITKLKTLLMKRNINTEMLNELLFHPKALIGSNSASFPDNGEILKSERSTHTFKKFLSLSAGKNIPLENSIAKITSLPAKIFGLKKRGLIAEGAYADIVLRKNEDVLHVLVNGKFAVRDGKLTPQRNGVPL